MTQNQERNNKADDQPTTQLSSLSSNHLLLDLSTQLLREGKSVRFRAPGRSMYPTVKENEPITVAPVEPQNVKVGDIVLYSSQESVIAHRVVRIEGDNVSTLRFTLCEDTWGTLDAPVASHQILGKVVSVERAGHNIDLYTRKVKMRRMAHGLASRFKRKISGIFS